jgi:hypothetical protein
MDRIQGHRLISNELEKLSDELLLALLDDAAPTHVGIGVKSCILTIADRHVFVKRLPVTDLEMKRGNVMSTANLADLPLCFHYGIGSPGFGCWRELTANQLATRWVLSGKCGNFSLLYHWRVLPAPRAGPMNDEQLDNLERRVQFWGNSSAVRERFAGLHSHATQIVLFLEFIPQTLLEWIKTQYDRGPEIFRDALAFTEEQLFSTIAFMNGRGLVHFDTHFENVVTDGQRLYFNDFGLALSMEFDLSASEIAFLRRHRDYDQCRASVGFMHAATTAIFGQENWRENLRSVLQSESIPVSPPVAATIQKYGPVALAMVEFSHQLMNEDIHTPYPEEHFAQLVARLR